MNHLPDMIHRRAVRQVTAVGKRHAKHRVARLERREKYRLIGLRTRMGLDIGEFGAEQLHDAIDRQLLGDIDMFAAAVVAFARITFGVLVRQLRALRRHDGGARIVLRRDQLDVRFLPAFSLLMACQSSGSACARVCERLNMGRA